MKKDMKTMTLDLPIALIVSAFMIMLGLMTIGRGLFNMGEALRHPVIDIAIPLTKVEFERVRPFDNNWKLKIVTPLR